jgi:hypothetical protein
MALAVQNLCQTRLDGVSSPTRSATAGATNKDGLPEKIPL